MRFAGLLLFACAALAQTPIDKVLAELAAVHDFKEAAISPDGARVAWVVGLDGKAGTSSRHSAVYASEARGASKFRRISAAADRSCMERGVAWSPDNARLAFLSDCG